MIPKECKRLAEVDFPIAVVSKHSAREKSIRHGHPSTLHLWWARRPLAACRAMLLGLLLPDPCDEHCPNQFKSRASELLRRLPGKKVTTDLELRRALLRFAGDFADWDNSANPTFVEIGRELVKAVYSEDAPLVVDPFAGGGSIPLEALRLGCDAFASDLNPLACLILKVMLEDIPRRGEHLADQLPSVGREVKDSAAKQLAQYYPGSSKTDRPIAYLWARTVRCESPGCGAEIPIFKTPWLSKKGAKRARYFRESAEGTCVVLQMSGLKKGGPINFRIARGEGSEKPLPGFTIPPSTKASGNNSNVLCPCCNVVLKGERVMAQLTAQNTGCEVIFDSNGKRRGGAFLLTVVTTGSNRQGKDFRLPTVKDYAAVWEATKRASGLAECNPSAVISPVRPSPNARGLTAPTRYGARTFAHLFTSRQRLAIVTLAEALRQSSKRYDEAAMLPAILALGRCIDQSSAHVSWIPNIEAIGHSFPRQAIQMVWDFVESVPIGTQSANYGAAIDWVQRVIDEVASVRLRPGQTQQADALTLPLPDSSCALYFTDPPYYDAVPYADLADFFLVWLNLALPESTQRSFALRDSQGLSPKAEECTWNEAHEVDGKPKDHAFFERTVASAFAEARRLLSEEGICSVVFAHKSTAGWEALLSGMLKAGWVIEASWPIVTERGVRTNAQNTASLGSSIHLICRPRLAQHYIGDWGDVLHVLPGRVGDWMERLQTEGVRGADLVFACIGPALEIFSRYSKVETAEGREVSLGEYLEKVWEVVGRSALEQVLGTAEAKARNGGAGALEEDARLTSLFLWTLQSTTTELIDAEEAAAPEDVDDEGESKTKKPGFSLIFDVARRFAQPLGIVLPNWEGRIIETEKGVVRLLAVSERAKQLFGEDGAAAIASRLTREAQGDAQMVLFPERQDEAPQVRGRRGRAAVRPSSDSRADGAVTTLDRVHAAMLLQANGQANGLRALIKTEQERGPDFLRLANALSALYPKNSDEKRLLDAMLLAVAR
jgi:putative DNA methylase